MDAGILEGLLGGLSAALTLTNVLVIVIGVALGIAVGAAPGMGPTMGMAVALPFIIRFEPEPAIFLLMSIAVGAGFGNSIPAILFGIPGTPAALLTAIEGKLLADRGESRRALFTALMSSVVGQFFATLVFIIFVIPLARVAVKFLFPEIFALTVFAMLAVVGIAGRNPLKAVASVVIGFALGVFGPDPITGLARLDFGGVVPDSISFQLQLGLGVVPVLIGLLAVREIWLGSEKLPSVASRREAKEIGLKPPPLHWVKDFRDNFGSTMFGTAIASFIGALPGEGPTVASFITYGSMYSRPKWKKDLGKGSLRALGAIDAANNAASTTALIPTLALGIPGSAPMIIILALLGTQGLFPGPELVNSQPQLLQNVFGALIVATLVLLVLGYLTIGPSVYMANLSQGAVLASAMILVVVGVYSLRWSMFDVWVALAAGGVGYAMSKFDYPIAPAALAFILVPLLEKSLRRGLVMTDGPWAFFTRPITLTILLAGVAVLVGSALLRRRIARQMLEDTRAWQAREAGYAEDADG